MVRPPCPPPPYGFRPAFVPSRTQSSVAVVSTKSRGRLSANEPFETFFRSIDQSLDENNISLEVTVIDSEPDFLYATDPLEPIIILPGVEEETRITTPSASNFTTASAASADYFQLFAPAGDFYAWYASGSAVDPLASGTGIPISVSTIDSSSAVAAATASAIDSNINFSASATAAFVTITNASVGAVTDITNVSVSVLIVSVLTQGKDPVSDLGSGATFDPFASDVLFDPAFEVTSGTGLGPNIGLAAFINFASGFAAIYDTFTFKVKDAPNDLIEVEFFGGGSAVSIIYDVTTHPCSSALGSGWFKLTIPMSDYTGTAVNDGFLFQSDTVNPPASAFTFLLTDIGFGLPGPNMIPLQTEGDYSISSSEGHSPGDVITLFNGATILVDGVDASSRVTAFTVGSATPFTRVGVAAIQESTTGSGSSFSITPGLANVDSLAASSDIYDITLFVRVSGSIVECFSATQEVTGSAAASCIGGISDLRTVVNANSILVEMLPRGDDVNDSGTDPALGCLTAFGASDLSGATGPTSSLEFVDLFVDATRTGPERALVIISTAENFEGSTVTPSQADKTLQFDGEEFIPYSILVPGQCPKNS